MRCMVFLLCKPPKYEYLDDSAVLPMTNAYIYIKHYACSDYLGSPYFVAYRSLGGEDQYHNTQQSMGFLLDKQQLPKYCYNYKATNIHSIWSGPQLLVFTICISVWDSRKGMFLETVLGNLSAVTYSYCKMHYMCKVYSQADYMLTHTHTHRHTHTHTHRHTHTHTHRHTHTFTHC